MKFGKSLSNQIEQTLPEWRDKFLSYKDLKKRLKLIDSKSVDRPTKRLRLDESSVGMSKEEISFIQLLEDELEKLLRREGGRVHHQIKGKKINKTSH
ncbi:hypothetical protein HID58_050970 [Brassica napus]|uniref:SPX domain-containing protein n=1 Tax=Brassica napus TaxID=3708 RepID=A0ABQ8A7P3_BRANA|nr:hypothetical protein HID58_050970 [Brassica napus]